jgi:hypothetical protein
MLRHLSWEMTDGLARQQWQLYRAVGEAMHISDEGRRRVLLLSEREWSAWSDFAADGELPAEPPLPVMLRRLGSATWKLASLSERQRGTI